MKEPDAKVFKWIADSLIRQVVTIDESLFGFVPGSDTTEVNFVIRQLKEKYFTVGKQIYMAIVDLQKAFDRVPQKVIRWAKRKHVLYEWIVSLNYGMYENVWRSVRVRVSATSLRGRSVYTRALGSVHSIVLDALSQ